MPRIAVLGGGVSGLAAALRLRELSEERGLPLEILLFEQSPRVGGCVQTVRGAGAVMELGPDSLLVDKPSAAGLLKRLQLADRVVDIRPEFKGARIVHAGRLRPIPPEFRLFTPTSIPALLAGGIFSPIGIARAALEPFVRARRDANDESVASFVTRRFGREVLERLAQPLIGGIYSGDPQRLGMRATLPQFLDLERRYGSLMRAMQMNHTNSARIRLASLQNGTGTLVDALQSRVGDTIRTEAEVVELRKDSSAWRIIFAGGAIVDADAIVCAIPAHAASRVLAREQPELAALLGKIRYNSIATINLLYDARAVSNLPPSTGFVVPHIERRQITAATFTTQKYPDRSPEGTALVRAFIGGALQGELVNLSDEELVSTAHEELAQLAAVTLRPEHSLVSRWRNLLPEYGVGHVELVADIERRTAAIGGLALAGAAYRGVGLPDCIATGEAAAESVFGYIRR